MGTALYELCYGREGINHKLFMLINHADLPFLDILMPLITTIGGAGFFYLYFALMVVVYVADSKLMPGRYLVVYAVATMLALFVENLLKEFFHVPRPAMAIGVEQIRILGEIKKYNSLPSGHAVFSFMTAYVLSSGRSARWKWAFFSVASIVSYSRVYVGAHYPLDVIAGTAVGVACGFTVWKLYLFVAGTVRRGRSGD